MLIFDIIEIMKNTFNNFLIKFIKIENIFKDYRNRVYNIKMNIEYRIYKKSHCELIIKIKFINNHEILINDIKFIINY